MPNIQDVSAMISNCEHWLLISDYFQQSLQERDEATLMNSIFLSAVWIIWHLLWWKHVPEGSDSVRANTSIGPSFPLSKLWNTLRV
jgi:hypothetical protein